MSYQKSKIKIVDYTTLREKLFGIIEKTDQKILVTWWIQLAKKILKFSSLELVSIKDWFDILHSWQAWNIRAYDIRQVWFKIHGDARNAKNELDKNILRTLGQVVWIWHMRQHTIVESDYAIKVINLVFENDIEKVSQERNWQIEKFLELKKETISSF